MIQKIISLCSLILLSLLVIVTIVFILSSNWWLTCTQNICLIGPEGPMGTEPEYGSFIMLSNDTLGVNNIYTAVDYERIGNITNFFIHPFDYNTSQGCDTYILFSNQIPEWFYLTQNTIYRNMYHTYSNGTIIKYVMKIFINDDVNYINISMPSSCPEIDVNITSLSTFLF